jgi:hypothetical protein
MNIASGCSLLHTVAYIEYYAYMGDHLVAMLAICTRAEDMMIKMHVNQNVLCGWCCLLLAEFIGILVAMEMLGDFVLLLNIHVAATHKQGSSQCKCSMAKKAEEIAGMQPWIEVNNEVRKIVERTVL